MGVEQTMKTALFTQKLAFVIVWCVLFIIVLSGCIYVGSDPSKIHLNEETAAKIIPGRTTRQEVVAMLGQPDEVLGEEKQFRYVRKYELAVISPGWLGARKQLHPANRYVLRLEFDQEGIVSRRDFIAPYEFHDRPLHDAQPFSSPPAFR